MTVVETMMFRLLAVLLKSHPAEIRYNDLWDSLGQPSKSTFSSALHETERLGLVTRTEASYRYVTYTIDVAKYREWLDTNQSTLSKSKTAINGLLEETKKHLENMRLDP
jgi:DNA-binding HxlR family transcriptional regulator